MSATEATTQQSVRKRPALFRALGNGEPPAEVTVAGERYRLDTVFKHDSWAATASYRGDHGRSIVCKFNRAQSILGFPMGWLGRALATREAGFLRRLSDVALVPDDLGPVESEGTRLGNAVARSHVDGDVFRVKEQVGPAFFAQLQALIAAVHARDIAYVDLHKRENVIIGRDGQPHLIDFQVSLGLSRRWPGNGRIARFALAQLQEMDDYHVRKHIAACIPETLTPEQRVRYLERPPIIRWHRALSIPLRTARRKLLVMLRIRDADGHASSEAEPEMAFRAPAGNRPIIAIPTGDPAGIGVEIALRAALDPAVRAACRPVLVGDADIVERHARLCDLPARLRPLARIGDADWSDDRVNVLNCAQPGGKDIPLGVVSAAAGRASIAFCAAAIDAARSGEADAVVAAPQNETSIAQAGIAFDGHPSFVARQTGTPEDAVYMMLCFGETKITHCTLHRSVKDAIALVTRENVLRTIRATGAALRRLGVANPKICVSGLNPHAGEGGLFGREEIEIIVPAIAMAAAEGLAVEGPFGADTMFHRPGVDAFVVMLHDQGHIAAKLLAQNAASALSIGSPILFASVAHGTGHDIVGKGVADPAAMIEAVLRLSKAPRQAGARVAAE